jgi:ribonucleoside-triphosphate reductase
MLERIVKRNGEKVPFDSAKIEEAIYKAAKAVGGYNRTLARSLTEKVVAGLEEAFGGTIPGVEDIQDIVEKTLIENGHARTAKAYILYRKEQEVLREAEKVLLDVEKTIDGYIGMKDWRVNENSNSGYSFSGLLMHTAGSVIANYTLKKVYTSEIAQAHINGDFHIHDLSMGIAGYCAGWSIKELLWEGFNGVPGKVESGPPRHLHSALMQMVNFLGTMQNEWAGAQAFSSFDTYLAPYVRRDGLSYDEVKQAIQTFVFNLNIASRWGGQTPFTNLTFDWTVPDDMKDQQAVWGGALIDTPYKDFQKEMDMINRAFLEVMIEGDSKGRIFTFPIPTYNITTDFQWDTENARLLFEMTAKYGIPYFQNFINSSLKPSDVRSMCCRLQLDLRELKSRTGGLFGSGEKTGSIGVVTINLPRIGYLSRSKAEFLGRLEYLMDLARESLELKRKVVRKNMENGLLPYSKRYLGTLDGHFNTIGLVGMNEALLNFMGKDIGSPEGKEAALEILRFMRDKLSDYQEQTGNIYNLEATPAEGTSYRLAKIDRERFPEIITQGEAEPYYTNSSQLPVHYTSDVFTVLDNQNEIQAQYNGGTVVHIFLGETAPGYEAVRELIRKVAHNYKIPYFTISPTFSVCEEHGYVRGKQESCPRCGKEMEVYSRVVGYYRPVKLWNKGKKEEFRERVPFTM